MDKTSLNEIVEYPAITKQKLGNNKNIVALLTDKSAADITEEDIDESLDNYIFDYGYVDDTTVEAHAYVCIEAEVPAVPTPTMKSLAVYVTVYCHKQFMKLDNSKFPAIIGNRRDNLTRYINKALNGSEVYGIGKLSLFSARVAAAPNGFTARELTYRIANFADNK